MIMLKNIRISRILGQKAENPKPSEHSSDRFGVQTPWRIILSLGLGYFNITDAVTVNPVYSFDFNIKTKTPQNQSTSSFAIIDTLPKTQISF